MSFGLRLCKHFLKTSPRHFYDAKDSTIFIQYPCFPHESLPTIFRFIDTTRRNELSANKALYIQDRGTPSIRLLDGTSKTPDWSHFDPNTVDPGLDDYYQLKPTFTWELAFSELAMTLMEDCGRWTAASLGVTKVSAGLKITSKRNADLIRILEQIDLYLWSLKRTIPNDKVEEKNCKKLRRTDKGALDTLPTQFSFSLFNPNTGFATTWVVEHEHFLVSILGH